MQAFFHSFHKDHPFSDGDLQPFISQIVKKINQHFAYLYPGTGSVFLSFFLSYLRNSSLVHRLFHKSDILVLFKENA